MNETSWKRLIAKIRESNVVPIIGPRLLVGVGGKRSLQAQIGEHLIENSGKEVGEIPLPPFRELRALPPKRLFDIGHEFPTPWAKFKNQQSSDTSFAELKIELEPQQYSFWSQGKLKSIAKEGTLREDA